MLLHTESLDAPGATPSRAVVFLHGILGSGRNLSTLARRFVEAGPAWRAVLVDLRAHGASLGGGPPDSVEQAAQDVLDTLGAHLLPLAGVVGHSFGGKVALALARRAPSLERVVSIDSAPGARGDGRGSEHTMLVLERLEALRGPWVSRDGFVLELQGAGVDRGVAQWLAMNVRRSSSGAFELALSLPRIRALVESYFSTDLWPVLEASAAPSAPGPAVHLVVGARSDVFSADDRRRAEALAAVPQSRLTVDVVDAGHWVHVDAFDALLSVLIQRMGG